MDADGTKDGYDLEITRAVSDAVSIPVVASGGAGWPEHLADAILFGGADAALAASIFHYGEYTIEETKQVMSERGDSGPTEDGRQSAQSRVPSLGAPSTAESLHVHRDMP